jgi:hypothetical protein
MGDSSMLPAGMVWFVSVVAANNQQLDILSIHLQQLQIVIFAVWWSF